MRYTTQVWKRNNHNNSYDIDFLTEEGIDSYTEALAVAGEDAQNNADDYPEFCCQLLAQKDELSDYEVKGVFYIDEDIF